MKNIIMRVWRWLEGVFPFLAHQSVKQFIRFSVIGVTNTGVDIGLYLALTRPFDFWGDRVVIAGVISFAAAATWSYFWNKYWTFEDRSKITVQQFTSFFVVSVGGLLIHAGTLWLAVNVFEVYDLLGKFAAVVLSVIWNFFFNKYWTFRDAAANATKKTVNT